MTRTARTFDPKHYEQLKNNSDGTVHCFEFFEYATRIEVIEWFERPAIKKVDMLTNITYTVEHGRQVFEANQTAGFSSL